MTHEPSHFCFSDLSLGLFDQTGNYLNFKLPLPLSKNKKSYHYQESRTVHENVYKNFKKKKKRTVHENNLIDYQNFKIDLYNYIALFKHKSDLS